MTPDELADIPSWLGELFLELGSLRAERELEGALKREYAQRWERARSDNDALAARLTEAEADADRWRAVAQMRMPL